MTQQQMITIAIIATITLAVWLNGVLLLSDGIERTQGRHTQKHHQCHDHHDDGDLNELQLRCKTKGTRETLGFPEQAGARCQLF